MWNESFFSAPQLKRDPLGGTPRMAFKARKTEHTGAKKGRGAFYGRKGEAKRASKRLRRETGKRLVRGYGPSQA